MTWPSTSTKPEAGGTGLQLTDSVKRNQARQPMPYVAAEESATLARMRERACPTRSANRQDDGPEPEERNTTRHNITTEQEEKKREKGTTRETRVEKQKHANTPQNKQQTGDGTK